MWILELLEQLFEAKATIQKNRILELPTLHQAVLKDNISEVRLCFYHGANINQQAIKNGKTALHYAAEAGNEEIVGLLLRQEGIDKTIKDKNGNTPFNLACTRNIEKLLVVSSKDLGSITERTKLLQKEATPLDLKNFITDNKNDPKNDVLGIGEAKIIENDTE